MSEEVTIAVDAMGGDDAPGVVLDGVAQALETFVLNNDDLLHSTPFFSLMSSLT